MTTDKDRKLVDLQITELERLFAHRHGDLLPDDDVARAHLHFAFQHMRELDDPDTVMRAFAARWAPWFADAELAEMIAHVLAHPRLYRADTQGEWLGLTDVERDTLGIDTICFAEKKPPRPKPPTRDRAEAASTAPTSSRRTPRHPTQPSTDDDSMCRDLIGFALWQGAFLRKAAVQGWLRWFTVLSGRPMGRDDRRRH